MGHKGGHGASIMGMRRQLAAACIKPFLLIDVRTLLPLGTDLLVAHDCLAG